MKAILKRIQVAGLLTTTYQRLPATNTFKWIVGWSVGTMLLTLVHHLYGAVIYDEPFRLHVAVFAVPVIIVLLTTAVGYYKIRNPAWQKFMLATFLIVTFVFSVTAIGLYEGGYNHVLKNLLYFGGVPVAVLDRLYPAVYELPDDLIFELTGIAQFVTGSVCGFLILRFPIKFRPRY